MRKILSRGLLASYLVILIWLVLFKFSHNISTVLNYHHRSLNLIPFAAPSIVNGKINYGEMIYNCVFFIPFGLLLNLNFKKVRYLNKLILIIIFSITAESIQYIFAIGATDITDVITNTLGGFLGLKLYDFSSTYINNKKFDTIIISVGILLLMLFISINTLHIFSQRLSK